MLQLWDLRSGSFGNLRIKSGFESGFVGLGKLWYYPLSPKLPGHHSWEAAVLRALTQACIDTPQAPSPVKLWGEMHEDSTPRLLA